MDSPLTLAEPQPSVAVEPPPATPVKPQPRRRPLFKAAMHALRRGHLYCGLFLLPWVMLYGVTAFLFNHPTAFGDQPPAAEFGRDAFAGTPLEKATPASAEAAKVVEALNARFKDGPKYTLVEPDAAKYARATATVTARDGDRELTVSVNLAGDGGSVRTRQAQGPRPTAEAAPFAVGARPGGFGGRGGPGGGRGGPMGGREGGREGGRGGAGNRGGDVLAVTDSLADRVKAAAPVVLERAGFAAAEPVVTAVPDLTFRLSDGEKVWEATYNALAGSVAGRPADAAPTSELSVRRFMTRLHTTHGYPDEGGARWAWALIVDAMAFVMVFWAASGLLMWWQIKATRRLGAIVVVLSLVAAACVAVGMYEILSAGGGRG